MFVFLYTILRKTHNMFLYLLYMIIIKNLLFIL